MKIDGGLFYQTEVAWTEGRSGELTSDSLPTLQVAPPPEFEGREKTWTPEHLFVASVNACFVMTFLAIAQNSKLEIVSLRAGARGKLEKIEGTGFRITEIVLKPELVIRSERDLERAKRIAEKAERNCPIANSIKTIVKLEPEIPHEENPNYPCPFAVV